MEIPTVHLETAESVFSAFPDEMNAYFAKKSIVIKVVPTDIDESCEIGYQNFQIATADQFFEYLTTESDFWNTKDSKNQLVSIAQQGRLKTALQHFENAKRHYEASNVSQGESSLNSSINALSSGCLYSKTHMAEFILSKIDKSQGFISGLRKGLLRNRTTANQFTVEELEGVITALNYRNSTIALQCFSEEAIAILKENVDNANGKYSKLAQKYTESYIDQEKRLKSIETQTNEHFKKLAEQTEKGNADALARLNQLEQLYEEKLKLQAPAQYWEEMESDYRESGIWWFIGSMGVAVATVVLLIYIFKMLPNTLSLEYNWMYIFKTSAVITIITSIAVYVLRLAVKMATSSFHLSRDARERSRLTYFYLALIQNKAVTDKERAIVLNSLFSRSDTGLLKGDSSPVMSSNVTDLVNSLTKTKE